MAELLTIGTATLYRADCRDVLASLDTVDVVLTDPVWPNCPKGLIPGSDDPTALWRDFLGLLPPVKRLIAVLRCDSDPRFLGAVSAAMPFFRSIQMPYAIPGYIGRKLGGDEIAYWFGAPVKSAPGRRVIPGRAPVAQPSSRRANGHPCSRAQVHFDWLVGWASDAGETVCDPFLGSGTTGVAAVRAGKRFLGIEVDPVYFEIAARRIEAAVREMEETS